MCSSTIALEVQLSPIIHQRGCEPNCVESTRRSLEDDAEAVHVRLARDPAVRVVEGLGRHVRHRARVHLLGGQVRLVLAPRKACKKRQSIPMSMANSMATTLVVVRRRPKVQRLHSTANTRTSSPTICVHRYMQTTPH